MGLKGKYKVLLKPSYKDLRLNPTKSTIEIQKLHIQPKNRSHLPPNSHINFPKDAQTNYPWNYQIMKIQLISHQSGSTLFPPTNQKSRSTSLIKIPKRNSHKIPVERIQFSLDLQTQVKPFYSIAATTWNLFCWSRIVTNSL